MLGRRERFPGVTECGIKRLAHERIPVMYNKYPARGHGTAFGATETSAFLHQASRLNTVMFDFTRLDSGKGSDGRREGTTASGAPSGQSNFVMG